MFTWYIRYKNYIRLVSSRKRVDSYLFNEVDGFAICYLSSLLIRDMKYCISLGEQVSC